MLALRPTFSESWYRVAPLKVKLRPTAQVSRQYFRGERWYVMRDPAGNQFIRLSDAAYRFVGLLDGRRTVAEAWDLVGGQLADDAPTQPEVIQILSQLYASNLVDADVTPDAMVLLRRHKALNKRKMQGRLMSALFPRIPIWDPDAFLKRWMPVFGPLMSKAGTVLWFVVVAAALALVLPRWRELTSQAVNTIDFQNNPLNALWLWLTFAVIKFIHEMGHAYSCRRFGGEVHEMGIMFLVFIPTPYVDASTAWSFPNKWARMFVGAAGMIIEIFVAALCAFIWLATRDDTLIHQLAYNAMLIASVSTVLFNANPLLRYDGYYMLSDWLEIPNLQQKSTEYTLGLIKRHVFRIKPRNPLPPVGQRIWLFIYSILSTIYRVFVGIMIILVVAFAVPVLGILMALGGVVTWAVMPVVKLTRYLALDPELHRKRGRAIAFSFACATAIVLLVGVVQFWTYFQATGVLEPVQKQTLRASGDGVVQSIAVEDGQKVEAGDVILVARDEALEAEIGALEAEITGLHIQRRQARSEDSGLMRIVEQQIEAKATELADKRERMEKLTVRAPFAGYVIGPRLPEMRGMFVRQGTDIATVATLDELVVKAVVEQRDLEFATEVAHSGLLPAMGQEDPHTQIRLAGAPDVVLLGKGVEVLQAAQQELPHASLGQIGGGALPTDPRDETGKRLISSQGQVNVYVSNPGGHYIPGQKAIVRFRVGEESLLKQAMRRVYQLIMQNSAGSEWTS